MLPVYICEDNAQVRRAQEEFIEKQILMEGYDMKLVLSTGHPQEILNAVQSDPRRGVYFLDVELKGEELDGFGLGQEIRQSDARGFLVYVTSFQDLAFETFRYHLEALDYIVKENPKRMYEGIRHALAVVTERMCREKDEKREYFTVKVLDTIRHIPMDEIVFFETGGRTHRIVLHAESDRFDFIGSMQELEQQLGERFLRVHRAFLVNVGKIGELDLKHREIRMKNGEKCLFSRGMKREILERICSG